MATYAGFWGPEALSWSTSGTPVRDTPVTVLNAATLLPTTLYASEQKLATVPNPTKTDLRGNLSFYAVPGEYFLHWDDAVGDVFVTVTVHPDDPSGGGGGVTDHGALTGLADDDHPQYQTAAEVDSAIDVRLATLIGTAPAALDTLGELSDALNDDASFAATVTALLAAKAPLASPAFTGTPTGITKTHVGLGNVSNLAPADLPVSTAAQTALDGKAAVDHGHALESLYASFGCVAMSVPPNTPFSTAAPAENAVVIALMSAPPGKSISSLRVPSAAAATYSATAQPAQVKIYDFNGALLASSADDATLWGSVAWKTVTLTAPFTVPANGLIYYGLSFGGFTGAQFQKIDGLSLGLVAGLTGGKRYGLFDSGAPLPASFNPATFGAATNWIPFVGLVAA